jgi:hypothetical protein
MVPAARKRIDPKALLIACALVLTGLTLWVIYTLVQTAEQAKHEREVRFNDCVLTSTIQGESLRVAEILCTGATQ